MLRPADVLRFPVAGAVPRAVQQTLVVQLAPQRRGIVECGPSVQEIVDLHLRIVAFAIDLFRKIVERQQTFFVLCRQSGQTYRRIQKWLKFRPGRNALFHIDPRFHLLHAGERAAGTQIGSPVFRYYSEKSCRRNCAATSATVSGK